MNFILIKKTRHAVCIWAIVIILVLSISGLPIPAEGHSGYYCGIANIGGKDIWPASSLWALWLTYLLNSTFFIFLVAVLYERKALKIMCEKINILYEQLDPEDFLNEFHPIFQTALKINKHVLFFTSGSLYACVYYSQGLFETGRTGEAVELLEKAMNNNKDKTGSAYAAKVYICTTLCRFYYTVGNYSELSRCGDEAGRLYAKCGSKKLKKAMWICNAIVLETEHMYHKNYNEAIELLNVSLKKSKSNLARMYADCMLAEAYAAMGNTELSDAYMLTALEQGHMLYTVTETQRRLQNAAAAKQENH